MTPRMRFEILTTMPEYNCAICSQRVEYDESLPALFPFCSDRCKMVDLGRWFTEQYSIDRDLTPEDVGEEFPPSWAYRKTP